MTASKASPYAEAVENPYRFGRQYVVFELLRAGHSRKALLNGLIEEQVRAETQGETRDAKALLDKVLYDLRHKKGIDVVVDPNGGYRLLPQGGSQAPVEDGGGEQEESDASPPEPPADLPSFGGGRAEDDEAAAESKPSREAATQRVPPDEAVFDPDDYTIHDVTAIFEDAHEGIL